MATEQVSTGQTSRNTTSFVYVTYIRSTPEKVFEAITKPEVARRYWGHGYTTEAAKKLLEFGFEEKELDEIVSFAVAGNTRSVAVMRRIGMLDTGRDFDMPGIDDAHAELRRHVLYTIDRAIWQQKGR